LTKLEVQQKSSEHGLLVSGVTVGYRGDDDERVIAAHRIDLSVATGEFAAIVGPSGCGKSTLLGAIAGISDPFEGTIAIDGDPFAQRLGNVAYMQQRDLLLPWRTVRANARLGLELAGVDRRVADRAATERARAFGLGDVIDAYPWQLSGGMRQRAALLRATLPDQRVLLLDEPFGALDAITRRRLQEWLATVLDRTNRAVVLVTHDIEEALLLADRVYVMSPGPGTFIEAISIDLDRPRDDSTVVSDRFVELKRRLMDALHESSDSRAGTAI